MNNKQDNSVKTTPSRVCSRADLKWDSCGTPLSNEFGDYYCSKLDAPAETRYVFLHHNKLEQRWLQLAEQSSFVIAETGFGTGLNFLLSVQLWLQTAPESATLTFISTEKYPLSFDDLEKAHLFWPEIAALSQQLRENYPPCIEGLHCIELFQRRVRLHLLIGDAQEQLNTLLDTSYPDATQAKQHSVDCWFLDGFSPQKNPDMWQAPLFQVMRKLSKAGTTLSTFTAAGLVKRGLAGAGFKTHTVSGFGKKRDMLVGHFVGLPLVNELPVKERLKGLKHPALWYLSEENIFSNDSALPPCSVTAPKHRAEHETEVAIIGAGLAGCINAWMLAQQGIKVTIYDRHPGPAFEASGNPQGLLYTKLSHKTGPVSDFSLTSYLYSHRFYRQLFEQEILEYGIDGDLCGVLQLAYDKEQVDLQNTLKQAFSDAPELVEFLDAEQASEKANISLQYPALFLPQSGWISPPKLCQKLLSHHNIRFQQANITRIAPTSSGHWQLFDEPTSSDHSDSADADDTPLPANSAALASCQHLIIANSHYAGQFNLMDPLPIQTIRGQITRAPLRQDQTLDLKTAITHDGYLAPARHGQLCFGATFELKVKHLDIEQSGHQSNWKKLSTHLPSIAETLHFPEHISGRAAYRCASSDYLPLAGPVPDQARFRSRFSLLMKNRKAHIPLPGQYLPNLYLNIAHGSRGLTSAPVTAALISALIQKQPLPLDRELTKALNPARMLIRDMIKNG